MSMLEIGGVRYGLDEAIAAGRVAGDGQSARRAGESWARAYARRRAGPLRVVSIGDSHTEPVGASGHASGWVPRLTAMLAGSLSSSSFISSRSPHARSTTGGVTFDESANPHAATLLNGQGSEITWYDLRGYTHLDIVYMHVGGDQDAEYGVPAYNLDNHGWRTEYAEIFTDFAPGTRFRRARINLSGDVGTLTIGSNGSVGSFVFGLLAHRGLGAGVEWWNWARSGYTSRMWAERMGMWQITEPLRAWRPDVLHIGLGANDAASAATLREIRANVRTVVSRALDIAVAGRPVGWQPALLATLSPWSDEHGGVGLERHNAVVDAVGREIAELGGAVVDLRVLGSESEQGDLMMSSENHWTDTGHQRVADVIARALT